MTMHWFLDGISDEVPAPPGWQWREYVVTEDARWLEPILPDYRGSRLIVEVYLDTDGPVVRGWGLTNATATQLEWCDPTLLNQLAISIRTITGSM